MMLHPEKLYFIRGNFRVEEDGELREWCQFDHIPNPRDARKSFPNAGSIDIITIYKRDDKATTIKDGDMQVYQENGRRCYAPSTATTQRVKGSVIYHEVK